MWETFIEYRLYPTYIFEFIAAVVGCIYLYVDRNARKADRFLIYYLIFIFVFDLMAIIYALYGHVYEFRYFEFINGTRFASHWWIANILSLITTTAYTLYFVYQLNSKFWQRIIIFLTGSYLITSIISYFFTDYFFTTTATYPYVLGAFLICFSIAIYYLELIKTDRILKYRSELAIYISIGLLIYKLAITPLFMFQRYISVSSDFEDIYGYILDFANLFMYSVFAFGIIKMILEMKRSRRRNLI